MIAIVIVSMSLAHFLRPAWPRAAPGLACLEGFSMRDERIAEMWDRRGLVSAFVGETRSPGTGLTGPRVLVAVLAIAIAAACAIAFGLVTRHPGHQHAATSLRPACVAVTTRPSGPVCGRASASG
jgi:hypothetical protein